jgi:hypothetical protein
LGEFQLAEEKKYPFTFKHMIHKLYKEDDWLRTVKEVLEKSKQDFKPLGECALKQNPSEWFDPHGSGAKFKGVPPVRVGRRASGIMPERGLWRMTLAARNGAEPAC